MHGTMRPSLEQGCTRKCEQSHRCPKHSITFCCNATINTQYWTTYDSRLCLFTLDTCLPVFHFQHQHLLLLVLKVRFSHCYVNLTN